MLKFTTKKYKCSSFGDMASVPSLSAVREEPKIKSTIGDFEGLFIGYGNRETAYPYPEQNLYLEETEKEVNVAILENDYIYAEFLVDLGGRLWKLFDKKQQKDVLYTNDVIRFRNLSIRNSWFSGGVEWNCGIIGHTPFTCSRMYTAKVDGENGEEVLRFYEFERVRGIYYQIDFWLDGSKLLVKVKIHNPNESVVPMYWWSNMATPEFNQGRVAVPADCAYNNSDGMGIKKSCIPIDNNIDVSYAENIPDTIDYFYDIPQKSNKFIANVDSNGCGLLQMSSNNLKGRKLFSWGHLKGSAHWQQLLTDKAGWYVEIQAGLGKTQYECIPMPPKTCWSFIECYTLCNIGAKSVKLPYSDFVNAVNTQVENTFSSDSLDMLAKDTDKSISQKSGEMIFPGSGFGYLQNELLHNAPDCLEFTKQDDIKVFMDIKNGVFSENENISFAMGDAEKSFLLSNVDKNDWRVFYQLALLSYDEKDFAVAKEYAEKAFLFDNNCLVNHLYAFILFKLCKDNYTYFAKKAVMIKPDDYSACESIIKLLLGDGKYEEVIKIFSKCGNKIKEMPRMKMYLSFAFLNNGNPDKAEDILLSDGGLKLLDFREGDRLLNKLYKGIRVAKYGESPQDVVVPEIFDFIVSKREDD